MSDPNPCPNCSQPLSQDRYCTNCGWSREAAQTRERSLYGALTLFVGVPALLVGSCFCFSGMSDDWSESGLPVARDIPTTLVLLGVSGIALFMWMLWRYIRSRR